MLSRRSRVVRIGVACSLLVATGLGTGVGQAEPRAASLQSRIAWVRVGNAGNAPDTVTMASDRTTGYGSVPYVYDISKFDVTNTQYATFLNAVASKSDPHLLYFPLMDRNAGYGEGSGILRTGSAGNYHYAAAPGRERRPVNYVNLYMSMRFANWLNNGEGNASTETGAYTLLGGGVVPSNALTVQRNAGAKVSLTSENEWYKAAYYDAKKHKYYRYPAGSDQPMTCVLPTKVRNTGNCDLITASTNPKNPGLPSASAWFYGDVTDVGAYKNSPSPYGTFDQGGNLFQWTDVLIDAAINQYQAGSNVAPVLDLVGNVVGAPYSSGFGPLGVLRGTDWGDSGAYNASDGRTCDVSGDVFETYGIRLARLTR